MGHDFLRKEFGIKPKIGWQLDPFGHSAANAELFEELGLETILFARMNEDDAKHRKLEQDLQFYWRPKFKSFEKDASIDGSRKGIFTHVLYDHYAPPRSIMQQGELEKSHINIPIDTKPEKWLQYFYDQTEVYKTKNVLVMWGDDFSHKKADDTYSWLD